jgi:hypothetical protein
LGLEGHWGPLLLQNDIVETDHENSVFVSLVEVVGRGAHIKSGLMRVVGALFVMASQTFGAMPTNFHTLADCTFFISGRWRMQISFYNHFPNSSTTTTQDASDAPYAPKVQLHQSSRQSCCHQNHQQQ